MWKGVKNCQFWDDIVYERPSSKLDVDNLAYISPVTMRKFWSYIFDKSFDITRFIFYSVTFEISDEQMQFAEKVQDRIFHD